MCESIHNVCVFVRLPECVFVFYMRTANICMCVFFVVMFVCGEMSVLACVCVCSLVYWCVFLCAHECIGVCFCVLMSVLV